MSKFNFFTNDWTSILDPARLCKIFFCLGTAIDIGGVLLPSFRSRVMDYGSRSTSSEELTCIRESSNSFEYVAAFKVPHTWFTHFYIVSTVSSMFWGHQIFTRGRAFELFAAYSRDTSTRSMTANQVLLAWSMMSVQGTRRLYESITLMKRSKSEMWIGLWIIGILYYIAMGIAIWIEGISQ